MDYLLDTNIIIIYSRDNVIASEIEKRYGLFNGENNLYISVVTLGELDSFIKQNNIGRRRARKIGTLLNAIYKIDVNVGELISVYGDIDAFSQGKVSNSNFSARNMGKNDLWIAASASYYDLKLLTTDKDFGHLKDHFLDLEYISIESIKDNS